MSLTSCFCTSWNKEIIRVLEFRHCNLTFVPREIYDYEESLEELYLDSNNIKELPRSLFHCEFLKKLGVSDNELCTIPVAVATLIHLEELDISKNGIVELPDNIKCCKNLSLVEISVNPLGRLPEGFTHLINLTQLYLNDTLLDFLPANFGRLTKLKVLELRENHLQSLPKSICRLTELERLDLGQNDFKDLPAVVGTLVNLKELWIDSNRIVQVPQSIGNLQDLIYFDASCNRIEYLPDEMEGLRSVADLHLSRNYLQKLPKNIGKLSKLTTLKIDCNQLSSLPYSMGGLCSLEELTLKANDLEDLPASIGLLRKLRYLNIDQNMLLSVPAELGSCSNITLLSLCGNYLEILPDEIGRIRSLTVLNLSNNKLRYLPYSFTKLKKLQAMWLSDNQAKPMLQLQSDILDSGKRVLTCFMFPQHRRDPEDDFYISDGESFHASLWEEQRRERMQIAFDVSESENEYEKLSISRTPSPYPKEGVKLRPHMTNDNVRKPWHSSPIPSRKTSCARTSYPKEGIKQRHRKAQEDVPDGRPHLASKMNGQAINALPNYPNVDTGRGRRDARMKEAKISRPRVSSSPIHDSLQLFRADKEKMAKDKLRIRHSSPDKMDSDGEAKRSDGEMYSPKNNRVLGRRELKTKHGRGAMSDSEATRTNSSTSPITLRRELLEAQSDIEYGTHPSDTQSDMGFHIRRRDWDHGRHETQSDVEFRVRGRRERLRNKEHEEMYENKKNQRLSDPNGFGQFNRNGNADSIKQSPVGQRIPRRSGYSTDPGEGRPKQRVPPFRTPQSKTKDDGYVHPSDYYKLPEYSVSDRPARTLDLKQLKSKGQTHGKSQPLLGSPQSNRDNRTDMTNSAQYTASPNLGRKPDHRGSPLQEGEPHMKDNHDTRNVRHPQHTHGSPGPIRLSRDEMQPAGHGVVYGAENEEFKVPGPDGQRQRIHSSKDYVDMNSGISQSSPMPQRTRNTSPSKSHIPSYEEALSRRRENTPPRGHSPNEHGSPSQSVKEWQRQHMEGKKEVEDYEPMRTPNRPAMRYNMASHSASKSHGNRAVNINYTPVHQLSTHQNSPKFANPHQGITPSNAKTRSLERHVEPTVDRLISLPDDDPRMQDVERDSGNSSNVTWSGSEVLHSGMGQQDRKNKSRSNSGITTRREMYPDNVINDTDSALTESPSPTYSSSGLTPSPQQPHFPPSVRIPTSVDNKVPLMSNSTAVVAPMIRGSVLRGQQPPAYQQRWGERSENVARDSLGYASEGEQRRVEPSSPSSFLLVNQKPPSPNSTVLAWNTSGSDRHTLPSNNTFTQPMESDKQNGAKMIQLVIYKNPGLGFSITGGWNSHGNPYKPNDMGIFVTKIAPSGPADGTLHPGDKILEVNGQDFSNVTHDDAVQLLRKSNPVLLVVERAL